VLPYGDADAVAAAITEQTVAILVEPIQGESGVVVPPRGFLARLRELATKHRVLLMTDEIQSGLGRTGKLFCYEHEGIRPDVLIVGKALGGGCVPISGILADDEVMSVFKPGEHGSTFGGNPLASAVARVAVRVLVEEGMVANSAQLGDYFMGRLLELNSIHVKEIRGKGLWIGVELRPEVGGARRYCEALKGLGILCKETHVNTLRLAPPLVITRNEIDWAFARLAEVLA
jgi:ornithine--oxo-acid transaminase